MQQRQIPLTHEFPDEINELIISYIPHGSIKQLLQSKTKDFEEQINIQKHAKAITEKTSDDLLPNLIQTLQKIPEAKLETDEKSNAVYADLCEINKDTIEKSIKKFLKNKEFTNEEKTFIQDCIMHFCFQFPESAGELLNLYIDIDLEGKEFILDYLIEHGADVNVKKDFRDLSTLDFALLIEEPSHRIINLVNHNAEFSFCIAYNYRPLDLTFSTLTFSALVSDYDTFLYLAKRHPENISSTFKAIKLMKDNVDKLSHFPLEVRKRAFKFDKQSVENAYAKLLMLSNESEIKTDFQISSDDAKFMLSIIKSSVKKSDSLEKCFEIYEKHAKTNYINFVAYERFSYYSSFFYSPYYPSQKLQFFELLRERFYEILVSTEYTTKMKSLEYHRNCLKVCAHDIFSDTHDMKGVNTQFKVRIKERISEVAVVFKKPTSLTA